MAFVIAVVGEPEQEENTKHEGEEEEGEEVPEAPDPQEITYI
jgi:hypothetical protein